VEKETSDKGQRVMKASGMTCVQCHTKDHEKMLKDWKTELDKEIEATKEVEQEALEALADVKSKLTPAELDEAEKILERGRENLNIVLFGNGVHNKKYSMLLIDAAITSFEDLIDYLEEGE
jgi:formate-dependent nitrite reductase cytochrome c552 subunit